MFKEVLSKFIGVILIAVFIIVPLMLLYFGFTTIYYNQLTYKKDCVPFESKLKNKTNNQIGLGLRLVSYDIDLDSIDILQLTGYPKKAYKIGSDSRNSNVLEWTAFNKLPAHFKKSLLNMLEDYSSRYPDYYNEILNLDFEKNVLIAGAFMSEMQHAIPIEFDEFSKTYNPNSLNSFSIYYILDFRNKKLYISFWEPGFFP